MKKNGKSAKPNTGKRGTPRTKASEPTKRRKFLESKSSSQKLENLDRFALDYLNIDYSLDQNLEQCRQKGEKYQAYAHRSHRALYEALVPIYEAPIEAHANGMIDELRSKVVSICDYNPTRASTLRTIMSRIYLAVDSKTANTYGVGLEFAEAKGIKPNQLIKFLKKENGIHNCAKKFRKLTAKKATKRKAKASSDKSVPPAPLEAHGNPVIKWGPKSLSRLDKLRQEKKGEELYLKVKLKEDGTLFVYRCSSSLINPNLAAKKAAKQRPPSSIH